MISAKDLTTEQMESIKTWASEGAQLPDIQKKLTETFSLNVTYMDTRFIVLDLGVEIQSEEEPEEEKQEEEEVASPFDPADAGPGGVTVEMDQITRPGMAISGTIVFSDGERAAWFIDQMGRPGLDPTTPGYQPTEMDLMEFEKQLREIMSRGGAGL